MVKELQFKTMIDEAALAQRVRELGERISKDFGSEPVVVVGVLKGAFIFLADLVRAMSTPTTIEFIGVSSYEGTTSTGHVRITHDLSTEIQGRNVLLVEDIIDTGKTIDYLLDLLRVREPKTLKICALLSKPEAHEMKHKIDYVGFEIAKDFVVGYGLDCDGAYRHLPYIARVTNA
jgi:hypoxanthine phosphoribosyltransferase